MFLMVSLDEATTKLLHNSLERGVEATFSSLVYLDIFMKERSKTLYSLINVGLKSKVPYSSSCWDSKLHSRFEYHFKLLSHFEPI